MTDFGNALISGIGYGSLYGLVALGLVVIFKSTGILNFSAGALMAVGALVAVRASSSGFWIALVIAVVVTAVIGAAINLIVMRPVMGRGLFPGVMVTIGVSSIVLGVAAIAFGRQASFLPSAFAKASLQLPFGLSISTVMLISIIACTVATALLSAGFRKTTIGIQLRAASSRPEIATMFGANPLIIFSVAWAIAGAVAAMAGVLVGSLTAVDLTLSTFAVRAFAAMIVGGVDSLGGALLGGVLVGVCEMLAGTYLGNDYRLPATMVLLMGFLLVRPQGMFGTPEVVRP